MSNSTEKMDVRVTNKPKWLQGKKWVQVLLKRNSFFPSFEDLHRIIRAISYCEDEKYPNGQGRVMFANFLYQCPFEADFRKLMEQYKIPERNGFDVINTNGAKVESKK